MQRSYATIITMLMILVFGSVVADAHTLRLEDGKNVTLAKLVEDLKDAGSGRMVEKLLHGRVGDRAHCRGAHDVGARG